MAAQLDDAGFVDHHVEALDFTIDFASPADWWDGVSQTSGRVASAIAAGPADAVAEARAAVLAAAAEYEQRDGTLRIPARTWVASAEA